MLVFGTFNTDGGRMISGMNSIRSIDRRVLSNQRDQVRHNASNLGDSWDIDRGCKRQSSHTISIFTYFAV